MPEYINTILLINSDNEELKDAIKEAIEKYEENFQELFDAMIDSDDSRHNVLIASLEIHEIQMTSAKEGFAFGEFESELYSGCSDMDYRDTHEVSLPFTLDDNKLYFNIEIPPPWRPM